MPMESEETKPVSTSLLSPVPGIKYPLTFINDQKYRTFFYFSIPFYVILGKVNKIIRRKSILPDKTKLLFSGQFYLFRSHRKVTDTRFPGTNPPVNRFSHMQAFS
ncbi:MAG: hypothetical protein [Inoviridae sp.]|nr:MAG: hypothetical protein [Inoviridae sp.]